MTLGPTVQAASSKGSSTVAPLHTAEAGAVRLTTQFAFDRDNSLMRLPSEFVPGAMPTAAAQLKSAKAVGQKQLEAVQIKAESPTIQSDLRKQPRLVCKINQLGNPIVKNRLILQRTVLHRQLDPVRVEANPSPRLTPRMSGASRTSCSPSPPGGLEGLLTFPLCQVSGTPHWAWPTRPHFHVPAAPTPLHPASYYSWISYPSRVSYPPLIAQPGPSSLRTSRVVAAGVSPPHSAFRRCPPARGSHTPAGYSPGEGSEWARRSAWRWPDSRVAMAPPASQTRSSGCLVTEGIGSLRASRVRHGTGWRSAVSLSSPATRAPSPVRAVMCQSDLRDHHERADPAQPQYERLNSPPIDAKRRYLFTPPSNGTVPIPIQLPVSGDAGLPPAPSELNNVTSDKCVSSPRRCTAPLYHSGTAPSELNNVTSDECVSRPRRCTAPLYHSGTAPSELNTITSDECVSRPRRCTAPLYHSGTINSLDKCPTLTSGLPFLLRGSQGHLREDCAKQTIAASAVTSCPSRRADLSVPSHLDAASESILKGAHARFSGVGKDRVLIFHIGTDNWQGHRECASGIDPLHASMHETFNSVPGVKCYSLYASWSQANPDCSKGDTFRVFDLSNIPTGKAGSSSLCNRWHSMSTEALTTYCKCLEDDACAYMQEVEAREGKSFDFLISHGASFSVTAAAKTVQRCHREGKTRLRHFSFVNESWLEMYVKEDEKQHSHPTGFLKLCRDQGVFTGDSATSGVWVTSLDFSAKFLKCFPSYPERKLLCSRVGINQKIFFPKGSTVARDLAKHVRDKGRGSTLHAVKRIVIFVGKFADWNRDRAVLYGAASYEKMFPDLGTVVVSNGLAGDVGKYEELATDLSLQRTFVIDAQKQEALADLFSMSEVGISVSYWQPFSRAFTECMACGTPAISAGSRGRAELVTPDVGMLLAEEEEWRTERGVRRLGERLAAAVAQALREDWKGRSKGRNCMHFVEAHFSMLAQCRGMLDNMVGWARPKLIFQIGTDSWHRQGELASSSGHRQESMHCSFNSMPGVKCYSIYPSCNQSDPDPGGEDTFRVFKLHHAILTWEVVGPSSSHSWYFMSDQEIAAYQKRLVEEVCTFMDEVESKEGTYFDFVISQHAFVNAMAGVQVVEQRRAAGNLGLRHFNCVDGAELDVCVKEQDSRHPTHPMHLLQLCRDQGVFASGGSTAGVWVKSEDDARKFSGCFPSYPKSQIALSRISANLRTFRPKGTTVAKDLANYLQGNDRSHKVLSVRRIVTFVGEFVDWRRLDAVIHAAAAYERTFPDLGTVIVGSGPPEAVAKYEGLARSLGLARTFFVGAKGQDAVADLLSMSEVGVFPSYEEPLGAIFVECMGCGTPAIGTASGTPRRFVTSDLGMLLEEEAAWRTEGGSRRLGKRLAKAVAQALREDWKGRTKGPNCARFVKAHFSTLSRCQAMLGDMTKWASL